MGVTLDLNREELIRNLAEEYAKSIVKFLLISEKYTQYNFSYVEYHILAGHMFEKIEQLLTEEESKDAKR